MSENGLYFITVTQLACHQFKKKSKKKNQPIVKSLKSKTFMYLERAIQLTTLDAKETITETENQN